jgi:hypothetical protein
MYLHRPQPSWSARILASARTLAAIVLTALLASALTVRWSDAAATGATFVTPRQAAVTEVPVTIEGTIVGAGDGLVALTERGAASPVAFTVGAAAQLVRGGENVPLDALRAGDPVRLTVDGLTGSVMRLHAEPAPSPIFPPRVPGTAAFLAALGLIGGATALAVRNLERLPALSTRAAMTRLLPVGATR